ncbi:MAG: tRNA (adenosine(37)-N6)-threonylcarbamoyltransferase complex ATPase subunit type 1 TsaE [Desulfobacterales bacterium]|nr:tRNA (adenosine(37)-N6)-threonylcarbamoyltransferase complex ATPase subunit type 1 TsaE [Desulfobacterales bacterium]
MEIATASARQTRTLGEKVGRLLQSETLITLSGDFGSGKTVFVQGLARGLDVPDKYITSPSYTLINSYSGRLDLYHADLYRIENPADFTDAGIYDLLLAEAIVVIEWAHRLDKSLPAEHLDIHFKIRGDNLRKIILTPYGLFWTNLLKNLTG